MSSNPEDTYEILNLIGKGSFGEIRRVRRHRDGMFLCRKEIMWRKMKPREQEQLGAEIRILRDLQHKNIVRYISESIDHETKMVYIYMEYCGNGDLYELIQARKENSPVVRFSEHTVWQIFVQLALALYRCHNGVDAPPLEDITNTERNASAQIQQSRIGNTVLHRDIKPHNVFLDHNNRVKLGDFGLSKELRGQNLAETFVGTPFYMSPEIIAGRAYNAKSDIWALGCVIFEMCAFDPPFMARDQQELNRKIKNGSVSPITRFGYSDALNSTIQSCLRQDEKLRPSAAGLLKRPEMVIARQQLSYFDREEILLEKETALIAREKEVERAINQKSEEFRIREDALTKREHRLYRQETSQAHVLQDSVQRKLTEAQHSMELLAEEKSRLEQRLAQYEAQLLQADHRPQLQSVHHSDFLPRTHQFDSEMLGSNFGGTCDASLSLGQKKMSRPSIGRAQTELPFKSDSDPLHLLPRPSLGPSRPSSSSGRSLRSPQRRKSQIPMSRVRPELPPREPLSDHTVGVQGLTRALSKQDLSRITTGLENVRPNSATGFADKNALMAPRTPTRDLSSMATSSPRRMAWPSPTRATARTLFVDNVVADLRRENQRPAPAAPLPRSGNMLEGLQKARLARDSRQLAAAWADDDLPSPYKKHYETSSRPVDPEPSR